ncbi:hypothetical protein [Cryobacterium sp. W22_MBD10_FK3]|uniref:hypothetical protein n=1 Tax=Cryobacterium sp. W22_MBD10_FK3 TaxID=3240273 RepID=UPI003F90B5B1
MKTALIVLGDATSSDVLALTEGGLLGLGHPDAVIHLRTEAAVAGAELPFVTLQLDLDRGVGYGLNEAVDHLLSSDPDIDLIVVVSAAIEMAGVAAPEVDENFWLSQSGKVVLGRIAPAGRLEGDMVTLSSIAGSSTSVRGAFSSIGLTDCVFAFDFVAWRLAGGFSEAMQSCGENLMLAGVVLRSGGAVASCRQSLQPRNTVTTEIRVRASYHLQRRLTSSFEHTYWLLREFVQLGRPSDWARNMRSLLTGYGMGVRLSKTASFLDSGR